MNKKLIAMAAAAMMTVSAGTVFAAPVDLDGSVSIHYRANTHDGDPNTSDNKLTFKLNASTALSDNVDLFARLSAQKVSSIRNTGLEDFVPHDKRENTSIDRFGFLIKNGDTSYKIGRQDIALGANETLYSSGSYVGTDTAADGLVVNSKSGVVDLKGVIAKEKYSTAAYNNKIYGLQASYKPSDAVTLGATLARYNQASTDTNYWAVNTGYEFSKKANVMAEYAKSNASDENQAYNIAFNYAFDDKVSAYIINHKTETNATMTSDAEEWTAFDRGQKGFYYGVDYKVSKVSTFNFFYKNNRMLNDNTTKTSFRTTLTYNF